MSVNDFPIGLFLNLKDFESPDTHEVKIDRDLVDKVRRLQDVLGVGVTIESGYRTPEHNESLGGDKKSLHLQGLAADISCDKVNLLLLTVAAVLAGFGTVIAYENNNSIHVDLDRDDRIVVPRKWSVALKLAFPDKANFIYGYEELLLDLC